MKRRFPNLSLLIVLVLIMVGIWAYGKSRTEKNAVLNSPKSNSNLEWQNVRKDVLAKCNKDTTLLVMNSIDGAYHNVLYDAFPELTFYKTSAVYSPTKGLSLLLLYINESGDSLKSNGGCPAAWLGDLSGNGSVAYMATTGIVTKVQVTNFPNLTSQ